MTTLSASKSQSPKTAAPKKVRSRSDAASLPKVASAAAKAKAPQRLKNQTRATRKVSSRSLNSKRSTTSV
jgi:hypothetical protein